MTVYPLARPERSPRRQQHLTLADFYRRLVRALREMLLPCVFFS